MRARAAAYAARQDALQRKCAAHELPWEPRLFDDVAGNAMHLATLFMSRCAFRAFRAAAAVRVVALITVPAPCWQPLVPTSWPRLRSWARVLTRRRRLRARILFEVASLERSSVTQHEPCLALLAGATRVAHKVPQFAGGFTPECSDLFDKARPPPRAPAAPSALAWPSVARLTAVV